MTMTRFLGAGAVAAVLVCMFGLTAPAQESAPTQKQLDIAALRAQRKAVVGQNMKLTAKQAQVFWPLYEKYEDAMDKVDNRHAREIKEYAKNYQNLTDEQAWRLSTLSIASSYFS